MSDRTTLDAAISLRQQIVDALDKSDLDSMTSLQEKWQSLIDDFFMEVEDKDEQQIRSLKELNDDILQRLTVMQSQIRSQHASLRKGSKASKAYLDNSSK